jgi:hypothetical protein
MRLVLSAAALCWFFTACGASDRKIEVGSSGGSGGATTGSGGRTSGGTAGRPNGGSAGVGPDEGGAAGAGGAPVTSGGSPSGGSSGQGGEAGAAPIPTAGAGGTTDCDEGSGRCDGGTPQICKSGEWVAASPCAGATPICSNGLCVGLRLTGGISTTLGAPGAAMRLVNHGFEYTGRSCGNVLGKMLCLSGGIVP